jgi:hypothetical protein
MKIARSMCKAYYAADVKRIMPPNRAGGVDNGLNCPIMGLSMIVSAKAGPGGLDAYDNVERPQMHQSARVRQPEPASGTGQRCPFSGLSLLRSPRSGTGEIRDAAPDKGHRTAGWENSIRLRLLASEVGAVAQTLRGGGNGRAAAARKGASAGAQADRRGAGFCSGNVESGARNADNSVAPTGSRTVWHFGASPQYRTGAGAVPKKRRDEAQPPAATRSTAECARQYEILRGLALETGGDATGNAALEMAYLESRGVAAWMAYMPPSAVRGDMQTVEAAPPDGDLIRSLANLVLGDCLEARDD